MDKTTILFRPVGQKELELIRESQFTAFLPRLPEQPIFYPVLNEAHAGQIARDWNAKRSPDQVGFVTRFSVRNDYLKRYEIQTVGGSVHQECWIPAEDLAEFPIYCDHLLPGGILPLPDWMKRQTETPAAEPKRRWWKFWRRWI